MTIDEQVDRRLAEWAYQRQCIEQLYRSVGVEESYPKPKVLTPLEEQDRVWKLLVQAAKN